MLVSRILMTTDALGDAWQHALGLCRALALQGVEVVLVSMGRKLSRAQHREAWSIPTLFLHEEPFKVEWMDDCWGDVARAGERLLALERDYAPDVVHVQGAAHAALPFRAPVVAEPRVFLLSWWEALHGLPMPQVLARYRERASAGLRAADAVVASSVSHLRDLILQHGPLRHTLVIPDTADPSSFAPDTKEEICLASGCFWDSARELTLLSTLASALAWPVHAVLDDMRPPGMLANETQALHAGPLRLLAGIDSRELAGWFSRAAIYLLPSRYEPNGLAVHRAALSGCALVLGDIPALRERWEATAAFVPPNDPRELTSAVDALIASPTLREELARAARERALRDLAQEPGRTYLQLYEQLLTAPSRRPAQRGSHSHARDGATTARE